MDRAIVGYHRDEFDDWVAELECYHNQHMRNNPPFINRAWVESAQGRDTHLGTKLMCVRCERLEMPEILQAYRKTPVFSETSIPKGLLTEHATKKGVWGQISVLEGKLEYTIELSTTKKIEIRKGQHANIPPEVTHSVKAIGNVRFFVEFYTTRRDKVKNIGRISICSRI